MPNLSLIQKIMVVIALLGTILIWIFQNGLYGKENNPSPTSINPLAQNQPTSTPDPSKLTPMLVSTKPENLDNSIILPTQVIELNFNLPLENIGEFKYQLTPKPVDFKVELSSDRKIVKVIPVKPFTLGTTYSISIKATDTKFDGGKRLDHDYNFNFRTIEYRGV